MLYPYNILISSFVSLCFIFPEILTTNDPYFDQILNIFELKYPRICGNNYNAKFAPEIGNGHLGVVMSTSNQWMFMNGLYNGHTITSHRARIPNLVSWYVRVNQPLFLSQKQHLFCLDIAKGLFQETMVINHQLNVTITTYASRVQPTLLVRNISLESKDENEKLTLKTVGTNFNYQSPDIEFRILKNDSYLAVQGETKDPETVKSGKLQVFIITDHVHSTIMLNKTQPWISFLTSIDDNESNARYQFEKADRSLLLSQHIQGWLDTWQDGFVSVESPNSTIYQSILVGQYYLLSSLPYKEWLITEPDRIFYGISPTGLAHGQDADDYLGHVFWDMETWMLPPVQVFHRDIIRQMFRYRLKTLSVAMEIATKHGCHDNRAARYPWESARTGWETTPSDLCANNEIHISGDISVSLQKFLWTLGNTMNDRDIYFQYKPILDGIARFWMCRSVFSETRKVYMINGVMPPDEYVSSCNNSVFTNSVAQLSLKAPLLLAHRFRDNITSDMRAFYDRANRIVTPSVNMNISKQKYIPEYDGYKNGSTVKQADVVLLQYPLNIKQFNAFFRSNQNYYSQVTDPDGPAMTWAIFSINYFLLGDVKNAEKYFLKNLQYITSPFYVWTETKNHDGAINFLTGIGGYLQNVINGYVGYSVYNDGFSSKLELNPTITKLIRKIKLFNFKFHNARLTLKIDQLEMTVILLNNQVVTVTTSSDRQTYNLTASSPEVTVKLQQLTIQTILD